MIFFEYHNLLSKLFKISKNCDAVTQFLQANNFDAQLVTDAEKENLKEELSNACFIPLTKVKKQYCF